jgi:signal transduction histidine kinase
MQFHAATHPMRPVIDQVLDELSALLLSRRLKLRVIHEDGCDQACFDPEKIAQVVQNLVANASRFAPENTVIDISYGANAEAGMEVSVRDTGTGIPPDELELVFDQFVQSSKTKTGAGGSGLGLAICRQIVNAHGGRIWAGNNAGGGACFTFTLPLLPSAAESAVTVANPPQETNVGPDAAQLEMQI